MILIDTSVWIDHFRGDGSHEAGRLARALDDNEDICICGLIWTEILQGIRSDRQHRRVKRSLGGLIYLPLDRRGHTLAADIYRRARRAGKTIRNTTDCIIAACAIAHNVSLLHRDRDFDTIASVSKLRIMRP